MGLYRIKLNLITEESLATFLANNSHSVKFNNTTEACSFLLVGDISQT